MPLAAFNRQPVLGVQSRPFDHFVDIFDRANEPLETSADWTLESGTANSAAVESNALRISNVEAGYSARDLLSADHETTVVRGVSAAYAYFECCVRLTDGNNFIGLRYSGGAYQLYKRDAGTFTSLGSYTVAAAVGDIMTLRARGNEITALINGVNRIQVTESFNNTETKQGLVPRSNYVTGAATLFKTRALSIPSADVNVTAATTSFTFTTYNPSVSYDISVDASAASFTFTTYNPVVNYGQIVNAATTSFTFTAYNPAVNYDVNVAAASVPFTFTTYNPAVDYSTNINAATASFAFTTYNPTVNYTASGDVEISAATTSFTFATYNPTVSGSQRIWEVQSRSSGDWSITNG